MDFKALTLDALTKERPDLIESVQNAGKAAILKELEEAKVSGKKSDTMAAKLQALIEADFAKDVCESVKKMIMGDDISLETAKGIIAGQKEVIESLNKKKNVGGKAVVTGLGMPKEKEVAEGAEDELPTDDQFSSAFKR